MISFRIFITGNMIILLKGEKLSQFFWIQVKSVIHSWKLSFKRIRNFRENHFSIWAQARPKLSPQTPLLCK